MKPRIHIIQWNVLAQQYAPLFATRDISMNWETRKCFIFNSLFEDNKQFFHEPTIICLQECDFSSELMQEAKKYNMSMIYAIKPNHHSDGLVILYNPDYIDLQRSASHKIDPGYSQIVLAAEFKLKNQDIDRDQTFIVCVTHLKASCQKFREEYRSSQTSDVIQFLNKFQTNQVYSVFLVGDFNEESNKPAISNIKNEWFYDLFQEVKPTNKSYGRIIDYIFYNRYCKPLDKCTVPPLLNGLDPPDLPRSNFYSDHMILKGTFEIT